MSQFFGFVEANSGRSFFTPIVATALGVSAALGAHAQTPQGQRGAALEEVVVSATRREEPLQDVAVAVNVVSGLALEQRNIVDTKELVRIVPSLVLSGNPFGNFQQSWQIRGVGTQVNSPTLPQSVAVVIDGIAMSNSAMLRMDFSDIERIEVLKGPQGTLFGPNSTAGVISIKTRDPVIDENEFAARLSYGHASPFDEVLAQASANVAVSDTTALRLNAYYRDRDGYVTNVLNGHKFNAYKDMGVRAKLLWEATDNLKVQLSGEYSTQDDPYRQSVVTSVIPGSDLDLKYQELGIVPKLGSLKSANYWPSRGESHVIGAMLQLDWSLGDYLLTSISGFREYEMDGMFGDLINTPEPSIYGTIEGPMTQYSQELRLTSPSGRTFEYVAGLYYDQFEFDSISQFGLQVPDFLCAEPLPPNTTCASQWRYVYRTESVAAYLNATIRLSDRWKLIAGGRATKNWLDFWFTNGTAPGFTVNAFNVPIDRLTSELDDSAFTWQFGPKFSVNDDVMLYATVSTGYKAGGFSSAGISSNTQDVRVFPETSRSYEVGLKSTWLDKRLTANVDVFYTTFKDFQTQVALELPTGRTVFTTQNANKMRTRGAGLELTYLPIRDLLLTANVAYTDAEFVSYPNSACYIGQVENCDWSTGVAITDASGLPLPNSPKWTYSLAANYEFPLTSRVNGFASVDWYHRSATNLSQVGDPAQAIPAYGLLGASVGVEDPAGKWRVALSGKNLLDELFCSFPSQYTFGEIFGGVTTCQYSEETFRTIYATVDFRF